MAAKFFVLAFVALAASQASAHPTPFLGAGAGLNNLRNMFGPASGAASSAANGVANLFNSGLGFGKSLVSQGLNAAHSAKAGILGKLGGLTRVGPVAGALGTAGLASQGALNLVNPSTVTSALLPPAADLSGLPSVGLSAPAAALDVAAAAPAAVMDAAADILAAPAVPEAALDAAASAAALDAALEAATLEGALDVAAPALALDAALAAPAAAAAAVDAAVDAVEAAVASPAGTDLSVSV